MLSKSWPLVVLAAVAIPLLVVNRILLVGDDCPCPDAQGDDKCFYDTCTFHGDHCRGWKKCWLNTYQVSVTPAHEGENEQCEGDQVPWQLTQTPTTNYTPYDDEGNLPCEPVCDGGMEADPKPGRSCEYDSENSTGLFTCKRCSKHDPPEMAPAG